MVRKESADTQECETCQQNDMDVDVDVDKEEFSFVLLAVSCSAGWHEPKFMCDKQCREQGFQYDDTASVIVEDDGELHTINLCRDGYNLREDEKEPRVSGKEKASGWRKDTARQVVDWPGCTWSSAQDHGY